MSYKIKMRDNSELIVPDQAGKALEQHWLELTKPEPIEISGDAYMSSEIRSITKSNISGDPLKHSQLVAPKYNCVRAGTSIQVQVRNIIKAQHPKDWPKYLKDESYREKTRKSIRAKFPDKQWCDHREAEHACI
jgi:hypothetical protein